MQTKPRRDWSQVRTEMTRLLQETPSLTAVQLGAALGCTRKEIYQQGLVNKKNGLPVPAVNRKFRRKARRTKASIPTGISGTPAFIGEEEVNFAENAGAVTAVTPRSAKPLDVLQWLAGLTPVARRTAGEVVRLAAELTREELAAIAVILRA